MLRRPLQPAVRLGERRAAVYQKLFELLGVLNRFNEAQAYANDVAIDYYQRLLPLLPENEWGDVLRELGEVIEWVGRWQDAVDALQKSCELRAGGDGTDWFFLAMARWQLGDKVQARTWYDRAVQWMEKNQPQNDELRRFRQEAEELLGIKKQ